MDADRGISQLSAGLGEAVRRSRLHLRLLLDHHQITMAITYVILGRDLLHAEPFSLGAARLVQASSVYA